MVILTLKKNKNKEVIYFQTAIFIAIVFVGFFGDSARNGITVIAGLFTIVMVFTSALMLLQFGTIIFAYIVSVSLSGSDESDSSKKKRL